MSKKNPDMDKKEKIESEKAESQPAAEETAEAENAEAKAAEAEAEGDSAEEAAEKEEPAAEAKEEPKEDNDARYMRLAADFQNYKRRTEKEKSDIYQFANEKIALDIIEVMDNFERALAHSDESSDKQLAEGVGLIYKQLKGVLDKNNILEIEAEGQQFDPNFHNAVMAEENPEYESGTVIQALQKGYTLNGKVIRPSMVRVAQ